MNRSHLYEDHHPYILNKVEKAYIYYLGDKPHIEIYVEEKNVITSGVTWRKDDPDPWIEKILHGRNPGENYFKQKISQALASKNRKKIRFATKKYPLRWSSSGGLIVLQDKNNISYAALNMRPGKVFYPYHLDSNGGLSSKRIDWLYPKISGIREILEELIIIDDGLLLYASIPDNVDRSVLKKSVHLEEVNEIHKAILSSINIKNKGIRNIRIQDTTPSKDSTAIIIHYNGKTYKEEGIIYFDYKTASIDIRYVYKIRINNLKNLVLVDGEVDGEKKEIIRDREILLFGLGQLRKLKKTKLVEVKPLRIYKSGKLVPSKKMHISSGADHKNAIKITPILNRIIDTI